MLRPSIYRENLWDEFFDDFFNEPFYRTSASRGQTDFKWQGILPQVVSASLRSVLTACHRHAAPLLTTFDENGCERKRQRL